MFVQRLLTSLTDSLQKTTTNIYNIEKIRKPQHLGLKLKAFYVERANCLTRTEQGSCSLNTELICEGKART